MFQWIKNKWIRVPKKNKKNIKKQLAEFCTFAFAGNKFTIYQKKNVDLPERCILNIKGFMKDLLLYTPLVLEIDDTTMHATPPVLLTKLNTTVPVLDDTPWMQDFNAIIGQRNDSHSSYSSIKSSDCRSITSVSYNANSVSLSFEHDESVYDTSDEDSAKNHYDDASSSEDA